MLHCAAGYLTVVQSMALRSSGMGIYRQVQQTVGLIAVTGYSGRGVFGASVYGKQ